MLFFHCWHRSNACFSRESQIAWKLNKVAFKVPFNADFIPVICTKFHSFVSSKFTCPLGLTGKTECERESLCLNSARRKLIQETAPAIETGLSLYRHFKSLSCFIITCVYDAVGTCCLSLCQDICDISIPCWMVCRWNFYSVIVTFRSLKWNSTMLKC